MAKHLSSPITSVTTTHNKGAAAQAAPLSPNERYFQEQMTRFLAWRQQREPRVLSAAAQAALERRAQELMTRAVAPQLIKPKPQLWAYYVHWLTPILTPRERRHLHQVTKSCLNAAGEVRSLHLTKLKEQVAPWSLRELPRLATKQAAFKAALAISPAWSCEELAYFEDATCYRVRQSQANATRALRLGLAQRRDCLPQVFTPALDELITMMDCLAPGQQKLLRAKLQPLLRLDSGNFCLSLIELATKLPPYFGLVYLVSLEHQQEPAQLQAEVYALLAVSAQRLNNAAALAQPSAPKSGESDNTAALARASADSITPSVTAPAIKQEATPVPIFKVTASQEEAKAGINDKADVMAPNDGMLCAAIAVAPAGSPQIVAPAASAAAKDGAALTFADTAAEVSNADMASSTSSGLPAASADIRGAAELDPDVPTYSAPDLTSPDRPYQNLVVHEECFAQISAAAAHGEPDAAAGAPSSVQVTAKALPDDGISVASDAPSWAERAQEVLSAKDENNTAAPAVPPQGTVPKGAGAALHARAPSAPDVTSDTVWGQSAVPRSSDKAGAANYGEVDPYQPNEVELKFAQLDLPLSCPEPLHLLLGAKSLVPCPLEPTDALLKSIDPLLNWWEARVDQVYGTQGDAGCIELLSPVLTNHLTSLAWYGARRGTVPGTFIWPERTSSHNGLPQAQVVSRKAISFNPRVAWLMADSKQRLALKQYGVSSEVVAQTLFDFKRAWADNQGGAGFKLSATPGSAEYLGFSKQDEVPTALSYSDAPLSYDLLLLEQLYVASCTPTAEHPDSLVAELMFGPYCHALRYLKAQACKATGDSFERLSAQITVLARKLAAAAPAAMWWADRALNYVVSCELLQDNGIAGLELSYERCSWVYNQAQAQFVFAARQAEKQVQRWHQELHELCSDVPLVVPRISSTTRLGRKYQECIHRQLVAGQAAPQIGSLPRLPQHKLPPLLTPEDSALLSANRRALIKHAAAQGQANREQERYRAVLTSEEDMALLQVTPVALALPYLNVAKKEAMAAEKERAPSPAPRPHVALLSHGTAWQQHVSQFFGQQDFCPYIDLLRPVRASQLDTKCWYGSAFTPKDGTYRWVEPIGTVDSTGVPEVLVAYRNQEGTTAFLAQLYPALWDSCRQVNAAAARRCCFNFKRDWLDDHGGAGFNVCCDATSSAFVGCDIFGTITAEENEHFGYGFSPTELTALQAQSRLNPQGGLQLTMGDYESLAYDQLFLEQIYALGYEVSTEYPDSALAELAFSGYVNALHYAQAKLLDPFFNSSAAGQQLAADCQLLKAELKQACIALHWFSGRVLNFRQSCQLVNARLKDQQVNLDINTCSWVKNKAQYWLLMEARRAEAEVKRHMLPLAQLVCSHKLPWVSATLAPNSPLGLSYRYERYQQLLAGKAGFDFKHMPPLMSAEEEALFLKNRARYLALQGPWGLKLKTKLALPQGEISAAELNYALQATQQEKKQRIAQALAQAQGKKAAEVEVYLKGAVTIRDKVTRGDKAQVLRNLLKSEQARAELIAHSAQVAAEVGKSLQDSVTKVKRVLSRSLGRP